MSSVYTEYFELLSEHGEIQMIQDVIDTSGAEVFRFETFILDVLSGEIRLDMDAILELMNGVAFSGWNTWCNTALFWMSLLVRLEIYILCHSHQNSSPRLSNLFY